MPGVAIRKGSGGTHVPLQAAGGDFPWQISLGPVCFLLGCETSGWPAWWYSTFPCLEVIGRERDQGDLLDAKPSDGEGTPSSPSACLKPLLCQVGAKGCSELGSSWDLTSPKNATRFWCWEMSKHSKGPSPPRTCPIRTAPSSSAHLHQSLHGGSGQCSSSR